MSQRWAVTSKEKGPLTSRVGRCRAVFELWMMFMFLRSLVFIWIHHSHWCSAKSLIFNKAWPPVSAPAPSDTKAWLIELGPIGMSVTIFLVLSLVHSGSLKDGNSSESLT